MNSSSRADFGGDARRCDRTRRGMAAILSASATRLHCVTSSFIPDFAVDLRSEFTKTVTPVQTVRFPPFPSFDSHVLHFFIARPPHCVTSIALSPSRENIRSSVRISRDDYATQCHATSSLTTLCDAMSVNVNSNHGEDYARLSFNLFCLYFVFKINFTRE